MNHPEIGYALMRITWGDLLFLWRGQVHGRLIEFVGGMNEQF
jgi:hypothetical protein